MKDVVNDENLKLGDIIVMLESRLVFNDRSDIFWFDVFVVCGGWLFNGMVLYLKKKELYNLR